MYILGIKCISLDINMLRRYVRQRPKAVAEIITFNILNPSNAYPVPPIPTKFILGLNGITQIMQLAIEKFNIKGDIQPVDKNKYLKTMLYYLKTLYRINKFKNIEDLRKYIEESSQECL